METVERERPDADDMVTQRVPATQVEPDARTEVSRAGSHTPGTPHDPDPRRAARVSAARALVLVRRRTGKAIPADVLALAAAD